MKWPEKYTFSRVHIDENVTFKSGNIGFVQLADEMPLAKQT